MTSEYVDREDGTYRIGGSRVSLDSVVYAYRRGASPESIQRSFPSLTLEEVHGALAFYFRINRRSTRISLKVKMNLRSSGRLPTRNTPTGTKNSIALAKKLL